ncbi:hypothetical protein QYM36_005112 [Artemia franciscana]|nr:hypothetical protein QYM36_005112 [Artemia franciscana]KAK2719520.1 hypothetical protein QYM36_005112 [Artemia franciscana]
MFFAVPFAGRILLHNEVGPWESYVQAFFHTRLELYLGNAFIGVAVLMLVALTVERYVAVCQVGQGRYLISKKAPSMVCSLLTIFSLLIYSPYLLRAHVVTCIEEGGDNRTLYRIQEHPTFSNSIAWAVYLWILEAIFKITPMILVAYLNCCIIVTYRETCEKRRKMTKRLNTVSTDTALLKKDPNSDTPSVSTISQEETTRLSQEQRLMLLLGSTSVLFLVCTAPQLILSLMIHERILKSYGFQVFRAIANVLELSNYSVSFYIYSILSRDFRTTFLRTFYYRKRERVNQTYL